MKAQLSQEDIAEIKELFGTELQGLDPEAFDRLHKELRQKYHPDKFERYDDEVVREMAKDKFQRIEKLAEKVKAHFAGESTIAAPAYGSGTNYADEDAIFGFDDMKIEIMTRDKDLKYKLFGTFLRWLERGDKFKIPKTNAKITIDQDHRGNRVGFVEAIRIYLTFTAEDPIETIIDWLYERLNGRADALIIEGKRLPVEKLALAAYIRQKAFLGLKAPD
ncbi:MAG: hypothetical protein AAGN35_28405 [Bacteroidota bacterium]